MCTFRLGTRFDAVVCLFGSIGYVETREGLKQVPTLSAMIPSLFPFQYPLRIVVLRGSVPQPGTRIGFMYPQAIFVALRASL